MSTIIFDVDGTVLDLHTPWVKEYNRLTGSDLRLHQITDWYIPPFMPKLSEKEIVAIIADPLIYDEVEPIPGVWEVIEQLRKEQHTVLFASDCYPSLFRAKFMCLKRHGFLVEREDFWSVPIKYKHLLKCSAIIDDHNGIVNDHPNGILYCQPWNKWARMTPGKQFIYNWLDVDGAIETIYDVVFDD